MTKVKFTHETGTAGGGDQSKHAGGWQTKLQALINANNTMKVSQKGQTSYRTRSKRADMMFHMFRELRTDVHARISC